MTANLLANSLSEREQEIARLYQQGVTRFAIARRLRLEADTVKSHLRTIRMKLGCTGSSRERFTAAIEEYIASEEAANNE